MLPLESASSILLDYGTTASNPPAHAGSCGARGVSPVISSDAHRTANRPEVHWFLMTAASKPRFPSSVLTRLSSSVLSYGPMRTRYRNVLSGRLADWMAASQPDRASRARRFSASASLPNAPACSQKRSDDLMGRISGALATTSGTTTLSARAVTLSTDL